MVSDRQPIATGHWHPPGSSLALEARLEGAGRELIVHDADGEKARGALDSIAVSNRIGRIPRRITFGDESMFETNDNDAIDAFLKRNAADRTGWIHDLERFHPRLAVFAAIAFLLVFAIYKYSLPVMVEVAVYVTPPVIPQLMSQGTMQTLDRTMLSPSKLGTLEQAKIKEGFAKIAAASTRGPSGYNLNFRKGGIIGPNAFALPDGTLVITDELIRLAGDDNEMILGVLAHEIGHVEFEHSLRQLYRVAGMAGLVMLIAGDIGSGAEEILTDGAALMSLSHTRDAEAAADRRSVELMMKAGLDPNAIGRFFALLENRLGDRGKTSMLSTHPGTPERRKAIEAYAATLHGLSMPGQ